MHQTSIGCDSLRFLSILHRRSFRHHNFGFELAGRSSPMMNAHPFFPPSYAFISMLVLGWFARGRSVLLRRGVSDELIGPFDEVLHIWQVGVSAIMLSPG